MRIADFEIGSKCFIVAELSGNHNGSIETAKRMVDIAKECGADAVKLQTFDPFKMPDKDEMVRGCGPHWDRRTWLSVYKEVWLCGDCQLELRDYAESKKIPLFSTVCDTVAIDFWEENGGLPAYKIAHWQATENDLICHIPKEKPTLISVKANVGTDHRNQALTFNANTVYLAVDCLGQVGYLRMVNIEALAGYSNHAQLKDKDGKPIPGADVEPCIKAVKRGAVIVEQHFTLSRDTIDGQFAAMPEEFERMVKGVREWETSRGA